VQAGMGWITEKFPNGKNGDFEEANRIYFKKKGQKKVAALRSFLGTAKLKEGG
jgi:hypothetical protein